MFKKLEQLLLHYPHTTLVGTQWQFRRRRLEVVSVRDLLTEPLTPAEFMRRPLVHRGRWLVKARDLEQQQVKQFYLAATREFWRPTGLRAGLYWPCAEGDGPAELLTRRFGTTPRERIVLANALAQLQQIDWQGFDLRITIDRKTS